MNNLDKRYHIGFWIVKIAIIFVFFHLPARNETEYFWIASPLILATHMGYFYSIYSIIFPQFFEHKKYIEFIIGALLLSMIHGILLIWIWGGFTNITKLNIEQHLPGMLGSNFIFFAISFAWKHLNFIIEQAQKRHLIAQELKASELSFLQAQINPHFLFNVLGCINGLALTKSDKTAFAIDNFNTLIKASEKMKGESKIDLYDELAFLHSYVNLQEMRFSARVDIQFPKIEKEQFLIEPLLILPLIENAFDHGDVSGAGEIRIKFSVEENNLKVSIRNKVLYQIKESKAGSSLKKLEDRLKMLYPNQFEFIHQQKDNRYSSKLKLKLDDTK